MTTPTEPAAPAPSPGTVHELLRRLGQLEQDNRRLRRVTLGTLVATAVLLGLAAALTYTAARHGLPGMVPDLVEAREFVLRDHQGRVRGAWGEDDQGSIRLVLQDAASRASIKLNLLGDGSSGLTLSDSTGNPRVIMAVLPDQTTNLVFADGRGVTRTVLSLSAGGGSTLIFADEGGRMQTTVGVDRRGQPVLTTAQVEAPEEPEPIDSAPPQRRRP
jgi:hypothetical protein